MTRFWNSRSSADGLSVGLSDTMPVGVDIERIRPIRNAARIARQWGAMDVAQAVEAAPNQRAAAEIFLTWWTRTEAALKCRGSGLAGRLGAAATTGLHIEPIDGLPADYVGHVARRVD